MVRLDKIYTGGGDAGLTSLGSGTRVPKNSARIAAYGEVDELNSVLGMCLSHATEASERELLLDIQHELFDLGADLCIPISAAAIGEQGASPKLRLVPEAAQRLEAVIDEVNAGLAPLTSFILPGGTPLASVYHLARTVCRRVERGLLSLLEAEGAEATNPVALVYLNRLSDLLFVLARRAAGPHEVLWEPGRGARP